MKLPDFRDLMISNNLVKWSTVWFTGRATCSDSGDPQTKSESYWLLKIVHAKCPQDESGYYQVFFITAGF